MLMQENKVIFIGLIHLRQLIIISWDLHKAGKLKKSISIMIDSKKEIL